jgi:hypothetical protein
LLGNIGVFGVFVVVDCGENVVDCVANVVFCLPLFEGLKIGQVFEIYFDRTGEGLICLKASVSVLLLREQIAHRVYLSVCSTRGPGLV